MRGETYCLSCRKYTKSTNPRIVKSKNDRSMIQSNCAICNSKKSRFIKEQQAKGLLSNLGIKTPLNKSTIIKYFVLIYIINKNARNIFFIM